MSNLICTDCGARNRAKAKFCDSCGKKLHRSDTRLSEFFHEDELKYVTVLFADIVDSTALVADVSPDEAQLLLTPAVEIMLESVREFGGTINRIVGDGVLAFFGFPRSQEDHALRACCAAQRMHEEARELSVPVALRIGLASGIALLSLDDDTTPGSHIAFGVTVHLAARLQAMAWPHSSLCSAETRNLAGPAVETQPLGRRTIKGLPIEQDVFEVKRVRQVSQGFDTVAATSLSPYVGRNHELKLLRGFAEAVREGGVVVAEVFGDAGAGKSRLVWEFARSLTSQGWQLLRADAISYGRDIPYLLIAGLLRSCFGLAEVDGALAFADKVSAQLPEIFGSDQVLATAILSLLDFPLGDGAAPWEALDPLRRREALRDSVGQVVRSVTQRASTVMLIEDLHWVDEESLRVLEAIASGPDPLLLVMTRRTGFEPSWNHVSPTPVKVEPLSPDEMGQLLERVFPDLAAQALRKVLVERAAGNPFFLEEMARSARTSATVTGSDGDLGQSAIPATIEAVLAERIDRLTSNDKRVLRAASVLGSRFNPLVLQRMFRDRPSAALWETLARLRVAGLLGQGQASDGEERFAHALIQEVTYNGLPRERRRDLHAQIVRAIETDHIADQAETLAFHALRGEVWDAATVYARRAGQRAAGRSAYREAAAFFEQAIIAYEHLPNSNDALAAQIDLRFELRNALFPTSGIGKNLGHSQQAEWLALKLGDRRRLGWATAFHARDLTLLGRPTEGLEVARRALNVAGSDEDLGLTIRSYVALAAYYCGDYTRSAATLRSLIGAVERGDPMQRLGLPGPAAVFFRGWLAWALARLGKAIEAEAVTVLQRDLAEETRQPLCVTVTHLCRGFAFAHAERLEEARLELQTSLDLCRRWEFFAWFTNIASCLGHVLCRLGDFELGIDLLTQATERTKASGILVSHANELAWLAEAFDRKGDHAGAVGQAETAVAVALSQEERGNEALARVVLAETLMKIGRPQESLAQFRSSLTIARKCRMVPLVLRCQLGLSMLENREYTT